MTGKEHFFLWLFACSILSGGESTIIPGTAISVQAPAGWNQAPGNVLVYEGHGPSQAEHPRLAFSVSTADPATAAATMRDALLRVTDGCQVIDEDTVPVGGRSWRRLHVRFATGPIVFAQSSWVGTVGGRTLIVVLSAPDERIGDSLLAATGALASLTAP
jgi:hypothetical protein